jgi:uncharacterized protein YdeI (BOF family)
MYKKVKKTVASANTCSAMEPETIQKNGENPKSHAGRNFLFGYLLLFLSLCVGFSSCSKEEEEEIDSIVGLWAYESITSDIQNPKYQDAVIEEQSKIALAALFLKYVSFTLEFKSDKSWIMLLVYDIGYEQDSQQYRGTYSQEGDHFIMSSDGTSISEDTYISEGSSVSLKGNRLTIVTDQLYEYEDDSHLQYIEKGFTKYDVIVTFKKSK